MAEQQVLAELDIIQQAQNGNPTAYGELYKQHMDAIYRYIHKRVGESTEAEDLTQTVFIKAWQALRDYKPTGAPFRAWLYRIAHNAVVDYYRTQRDPLLWDDLVWMTDPRCTPEKQLIDTERQQTVRNAIAELRPTYQAVIVRRFLHSMDYTETAAELGSQVNNVRVLQHRALEALRQVLAQESALWLAMVVTMITLLLGGNIVLAAERALPGDSLYPMRTMVEEVSLLLADDSTDIRLHADFATQRIRELQKLYQQGRIDDMVATVAQLSAHVRAASAKAATVTQADQRTLTAQFAQALDSQSTALSALTSAAPSTLQVTLQPALDAVTDAQASLPDQASEVPAIMPTATALPTAVAPVHAAPQTGQAPTPLAPTPVATHAEASMQSNTIDADLVAAQSDEGETHNHSATSDPAPLPTRAPEEKDANRPSAQAENPPVEQQHPTRPAVEAEQMHADPSATNPPRTETQQAPAAHPAANVAHPTEGQTKDEPANTEQNDAETTNSPVESQDHEPDARPEDEEQHPQQEQPDEQPVQANQNEEQRSQPSRSESEHPVRENERHR